MNTRPPADATAVEPFVRLAMECVHRPYPYHLVRVMSSDSDAQPPHQANPAFYGCFDWHSAVHGHWTLVRGIHLHPQAPWAQAARVALAKNLTQSNLAAEAEYLRAPGHEGFERPYGLAWLLQLASELREMAGDPDAGNWLEWLASLQAIAVERLANWLPMLSHPIRSGEHSQTAFALGLVIDSARAGSGDDRFHDLLVQRIGQLYLRDRDAPLAYEPSGHDFLSPALAEADLVRRIIAPREFSQWLMTFLPQIPADGSTEWLGPVRAADPADGKLSHLDGLNLSRAWMLEGIASALPAGDVRHASLSATARLHAETGLAAIRTVHYAGAHWLGSFAMYLLTRRGMAFPA
jgi:hypothetical protein